MTNTNTTTKTGARKATAAKRPVAAAKLTPQAVKSAAAKAKATKSVVAVKPTKSTKSTAKPAAKPTSPKLADSDAANLVELHAIVTDAVAAFEAAVARQIGNGVPSSQLAAALDIATSSIRRIGIRNGVGTEADLARFAK